MKNDYSLISIIIVATTQENYISNTNICAQIYFDDYFLQFIIKLITRFGN